MLNSKNQKTLHAVFENPVRADVAWKDIETLLKALGAEISEGSGSRVRIALNGIKMVFHRPHPRKEAGKFTVKDFRELLTKAGFKKE